MRYIFIIVALFISMGAHSQGIWQPDPSNKKMRSSMSDSVHIVPRDTAARNTMLFNGVPVGDSGRIAYKFGKFWGFGPSGWSELGEGAVNPNNFIQNQFSTTQNAEFWINGRGRVDNTFRIGGVATSFAPLHVGTLPSFANLSIVAEGNVQTVPGTANNHAITRGQMSDSLANYTLQRATEAGAITNIPIITSRVTSYDYIPSTLSEGAFNIIRIIDDGGIMNARGFRDNTIYKRSSPNSEVWYDNTRYAYAGFDSRPKLQGAYFNHIVGFQSAPDIDITGEVSYMYGFLSRPNVTAGIADSLIGMQIGDPTGLQPRNYFALYIDSAVAGSDKNYSIYSGFGQNYLRGNLGIGLAGQNPTEALDVYGNANIRGGSLTLLNGASNIINMSTAGVNPPAFTTRSTGTKLVLFSNLGASTSDHALGVESLHMWFSVPENIATRGFKFYGGTTQVARIDGTGKALFGSNAAATSTLQSAGSFAAAHTVTSGNLTLTDAHFTVRVVSSAHAITLPAASTCKDRIYEIINYNTGGAVTISSVLVFGTGTASIPNNTSWRIQSDGTNWVLISRSN